MCPWSNRKQALYKKTDDFNELETWAAIWLRYGDTGQCIPCFDRCLLNIKWKCNIKEGCYKPRLHVSVNLLAGVWLPFLATLPSILPWACAHEQHHYSHDNHEKIDLWVSYSFLYEYWVPLADPFVPPELIIYKLCTFKKRNKVINN